MMLIIIPILLGLVLVGKTIRRGGGGGAMGRTSAQGIAFLKRLEGFSATPYWDVSGYSIGYGHFMGSTPTITSLTEPQAAALLQSDLAGSYESAVNSAIHVPINQQQYDALVSFCYNVGTGYVVGDRQATFIKRINSKASPAQIAEAWSWYNKAGGVVHPGLVNRRRAEIRLFNEGAYQ